MSFPLKYNVIRTEGFKHSNPETAGKMGKNARGSGVGHGGWDIKAPSGTTVFAVGPGPIVRVQKIGGYGLTIQQKFLRGSTYYWALYAHLSKSFIELDTKEKKKNGVQVSEGQAIGVTGNSGNAKGLPPHLHFEIATSDDLSKGRSNRIQPGRILGEFLNENPSGQAILVERSYPDDPLTIDDIEKAQRLGVTA